MSVPDEEAAASGDKPNGPRSSKGVRTRARLVYAAKKVFEESGFLDARISDIAEEAGLSHGSFYHYFESKEDIFRDVAGALEEQLSAHSVIDSGLLDERSGLSLRDRLTESNRRYLADYRDESRIMGVIEQVSRYNEEVRSTRLSQQQQYTEQTEAAIRRLQVQGRADPSLDPTIVAPALTAMVTRFAEMWFVQGQVDCSFDQGVEQLATLCMNALQIKEKGSRRRRPPEEE